jgi:hypothetical protein
MKRIVLFTLVLAAVALPVAQANAAQSANGPTLAQFKALQKQVAALQAQVKALQKWVPTSCTTSTCGTLKQISSLASFNYEAGICESAVISDQFQATWGVIDQLAAATQAGKTYFGPQTSISDAGACADLQFTRPAVNPPTAAIFSSLIALLTG